MSLTDNTDAEWKIRIRQMVYRFPVSRQKCVELFAGAGAMTAFWADACDEVVAIDEQCDKLATIEQRNVRTVCGDNRLHMGETADAEIVDCDGYGLVLPVIKLVLVASKTKRKFIAFTDGTPKAAHFNARGDRFKESLLQLSPTRFDYERNFQGGVYYGWAYWENCSSVRARLKLQEMVRHGQH